MRDRKENKMANGTPLGAMYIELGLDVSKFSPTLNGAKNSVKYFQNNVRSLDSTLKGNEKNAGLLQAKYKTLGQAIDSQRKVLDELKKSFDKLLIFCQYINSRRTITNFT